ncbi:hypothetical protein [Enterococcus faecium]|nr:hypothetical protein [Enterococcus faecium]
MKSKNIQDFLDENVDNDLLSENNTLIYNQFVLSKKMISFVSIEI